MDSRSNNDEPSTSITIDEFLFRSSLVGGENSDGDWVVELFSTFVTGHVVEGNGLGENRWILFDHFKSFEVISGDVAMRSQI